MSWIKTAIINTLLVITSIFVLLILIEILFRFLPVSESTNTQIVNQRSPYMHFLENKDVFYSKGASFEIQAIKHSNNYGYMDDDDFHKNAIRPIMSVIGDSFVEALQVENKYTFHGLLDENISLGNVYAMGMSGAPLSQYLAYLRFSKEEFNNDGVIISIIENDFDESFIKYKHTAGFHFFKNMNNKCENIEIIRKNFDGHSWLVNFAKNFAFIRYMFLNNRVSVLANKELINASDSIDGDRVKHSKCAVDEFFKRLPLESGLLEKDILFVIDAPRLEIYNHKNRTTFFKVLREYFIKKAENLGYEVIDMDPAFSSEYNANGKKFEFDIDYHWNKIGHYVVYSEIIKSEFYKRFFLK